jgi:hypothetical protein
LPFRGVPGAVLPSLMAFACVFPCARPPLLALLLLLAWPLARGCLPLEGTMTILFGPLAL